MTKKLNLKKAAALSLTVASAVAGITFMTVAAEYKPETWQTQEVSLNTPAAGLSTELILSAIDSESISADFLSVSAVAREMSSGQDSVIAAIDDAIEEIEAYAEAAAESADAYDAADEAYQEAEAVLAEANSLKAAAQAAQTTVLANMYIQDVVDLIDDAQAAAEEAAEAAEAAAEEEAARLAAEAAAAHEAEVAALRSEIVSYACSFAGWLPYVHGGSSLTSGVDCSGFTAAVYAHFGYTLSHSSSVQSTQGRSVSLSEIQPGDIVVYSGHVAIYIGGGKIVHAPGPGRTVTIASLYIMNILDVRRIVE